MVNLSSEIRAKFVCRYALFLQARSHLLKLHKHLATNSSTEMFVDINDYLSDTNNWPDWWDCIEIPATELKCSNKAAMDCYNYYYFWEINMAIIVRMVLRIIHDYNFSSIMQKSAKNSEE